MNSNKFRDIKLGYELEGEAGGYEICTALDDDGQQQQQQHCFADRSGLPSTRRTTNNNKRHNNKTFSCFWLSSSSSPSFLRFVSLFVLLPSSVLFLSFSWWDHGYEDRTSLTKDSSFIGKDSSSISESVQSNSLVEKGRSTAKNATVVEEGRSTANATSPQSSNMTVDSQSYRDELNAYKRKKDEIVKQMNITSGPVIRFWRQLDVPDYFLHKVAMKCPHHFLNRSDPNITLYSSTLFDRSGSIIYRMFRNYGYAYQFGFKYGGSIPRVHEIGFHRKQTVIERLIDTIGLSDELKFTTPKIDDPNAYYVSWECLSQAPVKDLKYFVNVLRMKRKIPSQDAKASNDNDGRPRTSLAAKSSNSNTDESTTDAQHMNGRQKVAVHVRRGDAQPCADDPRLLKRYSPNAYYLSILDEYIDMNTSDVIIFSQSDSFESFDIFESRGYDVQLDGPVDEAWSAMVTADVFIMSPGSLFSMIPAFMNPNTVYVASCSRYSSCPPHYHHWTEIDPKITSQSYTILDKLIDNNQCESWLAEHPQHKKKGIARL